MASLLFIIGGADVNSLVSGGTNFIFSMLTDHGAEKRKRHDLALKKLQRVRDEWNKDQMKRLDSINRRLREKNEAIAYINNVDEAMLEYYQVFAKQIRSSPPESQLSDFYHQSEDEENGELLFVAVGTGVGTYTLYKYLK